jgi:hypothetical protein
MRLALLVLLNGTGPFVICLARRLRVYGWKRWQVVWLVFLHNLVYVVSWAYAFVVIGSSGIEFVF